MAKSDYAHRKTDQELARLEKRIATIYRDARNELDDTVTEYFSKLRLRDEEQKALLNAGQITEQEYKQWRLAQIGRGKRFEALRDKMAERYTQANETAVAYTNDAAPGIYSLNRNYAAYTIEQTGANVDFTLFDEQTVKRLIVEQPDLMPYYPQQRALHRGIDLAYGKQQITSSVTSGILMGKSVGKIANDLQDRMQTMNRNSAIRTARTAVTGAQNAGRQDGYDAAEKMGLKMVKEWIATLDNRTRHAHAIADGQTVPANMPFKLDGYEMQFPGDTSAPGYLVYNCRCTMAARPEHVDMSDAQRRARNPETGRNEVIPNVTYQQWAEQKQAENKTAWDVYMTKGKNRAADQRQYAEYRAIIGRNAGDTFDKFQEMKYNDAEKWEYTKRFVSYKRKYPTSNKKYFDVQEQLRADGLRNIVVLPPEVKRAYLLPTPDRQPYHMMQRMVERNLTSEDLAHYVESAKIMIVQQGGRVQKFVSKDGVTVILRANDMWLYKTAWKKEDFDEVTDKMLEVIKNARL